MPSGSSTENWLPEPRIRKRRQAIVWHCLRSQSGPPRETNLCPRNRVRYSDPYSKAAGAYRAGLTQMRMVKKYIVITLLILIAAVIVRILRTMA